jgi:hypothetical protein
MFIHLEVAAPVEQMMQEFIEDVIALKNWIDSLPEGSSCGSHNDYP